MLPQDGRPGDDPNAPRVDPEEFANQINYLAALGRLVVPRAFAFVGRRVIFVGHEPFDAEELGSLLPDGAEWYEQEYAPEEFVPDVVVLGRSVPKGSVKSVVASAKRPPKVVPQEGFVDELLFGHDWWEGKRESLREMAHPHKGLQAAQSVGALRPVGMEPPQAAQKTTPARVPPKPTKAKVRTPPAPTKPAATSFSWPSTEAKETRGAGDGELDLKARSRLNELGYTTGEPRSVRWRILTTRAIPELGLQQVVLMIAWYCRFFRNHPKFARALGEWEHDLARLKREVYPKHRPRFSWPRSEP